MADGSGLIRIGGTVSAGVMFRVREAEAALDKARFLKFHAGAKPRARVRDAIKLLEAKAGRLLREAEDMARSEDESAWLEGAIAESLALAVLRGEIVVEQPVPGSKSKRRLMLSRGMGLEHARDNGYLAARHGPDETDDLYALGQAYRTAYEVIAGLASHRGEVMGGASGFSAKGVQTRVIEAGEVLALVRGAATARQVQVLDRICGDGMGMAVAAQALKMGLPACRNALRGGQTPGLAAKRKARQVGAAPRDLAAAHAAVAAAGRGL